MGVTPIVLGAIALAGAAAQTSSSINQQHAARVDANHQADAQNLAQKQVTDQQNLVQSNANRDAQRARQRVLTAGSSGTRSTILTSPLGVTGIGDTTGNNTAVATAQAGKTLIGT